MAYTPTYSQSDIGNIATDSVAKIILTAGTLASLIIIGIIAYFFIKKR